jgi:hypothetical protein
MSKSWVLDAGYRPLAATSPECQRTTDDPKTAQGILRHANSDVTMQIYTHAQDEAKRKALEKVEARLVQ